ncbi:hypothetical protein E4U55_008097 [Claviceps digitariae]|nr:hypothetical protein E4U55_008097 [Claviceps digitariae]
MPPFPTCRSDLLPILAEGLSASHGSSRPLPTNGLESFYRHSEKEKQASHFLRIIRKVKNCIRARHELYLDTFISEAVLANDQTIMMDMRQCPPHVGLVARRLPGRLTLHSGKPQSPLGEKKVGNEDPGDPSHDNGAKIVPCLLAWRCGNRLFVDNIMRFYDANPSAPSYRVKLATACPWSFGSTVQNITTQDAERLSKLTQELDIDRRYTIIIRMKTPSIAIAALLATAADIAIAAPQANCKADSCLKALRSSHVAGHDAKTFCAKYSADPADRTDVPRHVADHCKDKSGALSQLRISSACDCLTTPIKSVRDAAPKSKSTGSSSSAAPCAQISALAGKPREQPPFVMVPAALAYECLQSVPLGKQEAIQFVDAIAPYLEWQSDPAYKKNPPKNYFYPGFDLFANLAKVKSNLQAGKYANEYDFQVDLYKQVWAPGQDGHYVLYPDLLSTAFKWSRQPVPLVSISEDGKSLPVIKLQSDVVANPKTAPVVTKINGVDAAQYLEDTVNSASYLQDPDAAYNTMFWSKSGAAMSGSGNFVTGGRSGLFYHGPTTSLTFSNGTTVELENQAAVIGDMSGVVDGPSMYKKFCSSKTAVTSPKPPPSSSSLTGYPSPQISTQDGVVTGYYLSGAGVDDVAVLTITSFDPASPAEFQAVIMDFLSEASDAGKKKLVVDLQNNGGGLVLLGYDFFRQLFPTTVQDGNSRWKLTKSMGQAAKVVSDVVKTWDITASSDNDLIELSEQWLNFRHDLNISNENFLTLADKFGPHVFQNTEYTALMRLNLSDPLLTTDPVHGLGIGITGYGSLTEQPQYFQPEDIVLLYDGSCSSTCTVASEFLRLSGGVKSVAMGGRPKQGPMQGVGGIKGSQVYSFMDVYNVAQAVLGMTNDTAVQTEMNRFTTLPMQRSRISSLNVRDQILAGNVNDGLPAQYVYEAADCRLYWTAPMITDVNEVWKAAANAAFNGAKCAYGGITRSKHGRSTEPARAPAPRGAAMPARLSQQVDKSPVERSTRWVARHLQLAIN